MSHFNSTFAPQTTAHTTAHGSGRVGANSSIYNNFQATQWAHVFIDQDISRSGSSTIVPTQALATPRPRHALPVVGSTSRVEVPTANSAYAVGTSQQRVGAIVFDWVRELEELCVSRGWKMTYSEYSNGRGRNTGWQASWGIRVAHHGRAFEHMSEDDWHADSMDMARKWAAREMIAIITLAQTLAGAAPLSPDVLEDAEYRLRSDLADFKLWQAESYADKLGRRGRAARDGCLMAVRSSAYTDWYRHSRTLL